MGGQLVYAEQKGRQQGSVASWTPRARESMDRPAAKSKKSEK